MSTLGIVVSVLILGPPWIYLAYVLAVEPFRLWRRHRNEKPVLASPILTHGELTRRQAKRALKRAGYVEMDTPLGKERVGLN